MAQAEYSNITVDYRGLTRGEIKALWGQDIHPEKILGEADPAERDRKMEAVISAVCAADLAQLTPGEMLDLFERVCEATYLPPEREKNFGAPQSSGSPETSGTAAPAGKKASRRKGAARKS